uniref:Uncharacterized protein n=1 Tax=Anopheles culicifacies TaxID=139723 RepID=A0A182MBA5_9DIPT
MTNLDYSQTPFGETFSTVGELPWNAKVLVLVDDPYLYDGTAVVLLEQWFRHFAISYWSVTSVHGSAYLQYSLDYGNQFITVNGPLEFQGPYSYNRLSINYRVRIHAQALLTFNFIKFVLLECYLARVTSLLLVYRYEQDPETLEQFFATDIPIQMLPEHKTFIDTLAPAVSQAILNRAVLVSGLDKVSNTFAYIDSVGRATYTIALLQSLDPSTGRKLSYILPEPLATYPAAYLFARTAAPLRDCVAIHLDWMRAFGYVKLTDRMNNVLLDADMRRVLISEQLVHVEHMVPLLVFLALGWTISVVAFVGERFVYALEIIMQSREA